MKDLTDPKEKPLFFIFAFLAALVWGGLIYITNGFFLTVIPIFLSFIFYFSLGLYRISRVRALLFRENNFPTFTLSILSVAERSA